MSDTPLQRDRFILGTTGRFTAGAWIAPFAVLDHFGGALQRTNLADPRDVTPVPFDPEFEILVGIEPMRVDGKRLELNKLNGQGDVCRVYHMN